MDRFHISATGLSINYMPEYLADKLGYFAQEGLVVTSYVPSPWTKVLTDIDSGEAQAVVGGIWCPLIYKNRIKDYFAFAKVASRCPLVMLSRAPIKVFDWTFLEKKKVLVSGGNGASPGLFVAGCAKEGGADVSKIQLIHDFTADMLLELFKGGFGDIIVLKSDLAAQLEAEGKGYVVADLTKIGGPVPWSVYYATPEMLSNHDTLAGRFTLALQRANTWLLEHDGYECREILAQNWPKVDIQTSIDMVNMFRKEGMWSPNVRIGEEELNRWQGFLKQGGVIDSMIPYDKIVDSAPFNYAARQLAVEHA